MGNICHKFNDWFDFMGKQFDQITACFYFRKAELNFSHSLKYETLRQALHLPTSRHRSAPHPWPSL